MRGLLLALLLLATPIAQASGTPGDTTDLIVLLREPSDDVPRGALPLSVVPGYVLPDAPRFLAPLLASRPGVLRVDEAQPLELDQAEAEIIPPQWDQRLVRAEGLPYTGEGVTVAIVDTGIDTTHPDLRGRVKANVRLEAGRFVDATGDAGGHGTHVAGILAADGTSSHAQRQGIAPAANLVGLDISDRFTTASALLAYDWLHLHHERLGIRVVVNAWGRVDPEASYDPRDAVVRAIDRLIGEDVIVLFSASNHGPKARSLSLEAMHPRVVTVGAVDDAARLLDFSSRGPVRAEDPGAEWIKPDLVAPGHHVLSLRSLQTAPDPDDPSPFHRRLSGTSQAVPQVAGVVALMLQANASLTPKDVSNALRESAIDLGAPGPDDQTGFGLLDARDALHRARGEPPDRANVLVEGGVETYQANATLPATPVSLLGFPQHRDLWSLDFPVKPGATRLAFTLEASAATNLEVHLQRDGKPTGTWRANDQTPTGARVLGRLDDPPPGLYRATLRAAAPTPLEIHTRIDIALQANATRSLPLDERYLLPDPPHESATARTIAGLLAQARLLHAAHPGAAPAFLAGLLLAIALLRTPKPKRVIRQIHLEPYDADAGPKPEK